MSRLDEIKIDWYYEDCVGDDNVVWLIEQTEQNIKKDEIISHQRKQIKDMNKKLAKQRHNINELGGGRK